MAEAERTTTGRDLNGSTENDSIEEDPSPSVPRTTSEGTVDDRTISPTRELSWL